jgi:hypothetical protein
MLAVVAFIFAFGWTYGFATIAVGRINLLSNVFMLVLVAAGLDYGVHVLARYLEDRRREPAARLDRVIATATVTSLRGNVTGALTSCIVFLTAMATDFQGLKELGVIATGGLLLCVAAMGFVLPALMTLVERPGPMRVAPIARSGRFGFPSVRPVATLAVLGAATAILSWGLPRLHFEENLLQLQNPMLGSVKWEKRLADESSGNSWFGAAIVDRIEDVPAVLARAAARPSIGIARSVLDVVKPPTPGREAMRERIDGGRATTAASARDAQSVLDPRAPADAQPSVDPATPSTTPGSGASSARRSPRFGWSPAPPPSSRPRMRSASDRSSRRRSARSPRCAVPTGRPWPPGSRRRSLPRAPRCGRSSTATRCRCATRFPAPRGTRRCRPTGASW